MENKKYIRSLLFLCYDMGKNDLSISEFDKWVNEVLDDD